MLPTVQRDWAGLLIMAKQSLCIVLSIHECRTVGLTEDQRIPFQRNCSMLS